MPSDIVQVIDRVLSAAANEIGGPSKGFSEDAARLRALRDRIVEDRKAKVAWIVSESSRDFLAARDTERALLDLCREVGT